MRALLPALLSIALLGGCRGYLADHVGPETSIMGPELARYGLSGTQSQCFGDRLTQGLTVWQLRQYANVTKLIKEPARLNPRELVWLASHVKDDRVAPEVRRIAGACGIESGGASTATIAAATAPEPASPAAEVVAQPVANEPAGTAEAPPTPPAPAAPTAAAAPVSRWLNLGSGTDKRSISIDASTLEGEAPLRSAWFRIVAPGASGTSNSYLLQIDCTARTVNPLATRKHDAAGAVTEEERHGENGAGANPIQGGSVIEIAYLSLCT